LTVCTDQTFDYTNISTSSPPTTSPSTTSLIVGALAGGIVGGVVVVSLPALAFYWDRRRKHQPETNPDAEAVEGAEAEAGGEPVAEVDAKHVSMLESPPPKCELFTGQGELVLAHETIYHELAGNTLSSADR
jgi:hypothetical protein